MHFSEYIVLDKAGQAIDPLGFRRPGGLLQDMLFPQFTVLTLHPAYLGALCCIIHTLGTDALSDPRQFARQFRALEIYWGLANTEAGQSVINVTKYQSIRADVVRLTDISKRHAIFQRLAYGTLGHYASAAIHWGLLDATGRKLRPRGEELANTFSSRHAGKDFSETLRQWVGGAASSRSALAEAGKLFGIGAQPSRAEQRLWQEIIEDWCGKHPSTLPLWQVPMTGLQMGDGRETPDTYQAFLRQLDQTYPQLRKEVVATRRFEQLAAAIQFIFDRQVAVIEFSEEFRDLLPAGADAFAALVVQLAKDYASAPGFHDARRLFVTVAAAPPNFRSLTSRVIEHHSQHQEAKGTLPFIRDGKIQVTGRVDRLVIADAMSAFADRVGNPRGQLEDLQFRFRRQWHFEKCRRWHDWSVGAVAELAA